MLYILPPPRAPNPPSPWESILCANGGDNNSGTSNEGPTWKNNNNNIKRPRVRLRDLNFGIRNDDGTTGVQDDVDLNRNPKSLSECYFAGKGTALVLPAAEAQNNKSSRRSGTQGANIQKHLQSMFYLLRAEETLKMAVKLESVHPTRTRYLVVVSRMGDRGEESCLLGIDCNEKTTVGLVLRVLADTSIRLDGDGGFSVSVCGQHHIFKPVSVQAMWSALQSLHKVSSKAREQNFFQGGVTHGWVSYYEDKIESDRSCLNEWHAMDNLESKRPPSPDSIRTKPTERDETEKVIRTTLKEIMMSVDLDEVTSKYIRSRLEEQLDMDLGEYKSFIDQEMLIILGQMDSPTEIFDHVYLGSEWNASNYEELQRNGVGHILNVTLEIDNFFPGTFDYLNIRVPDDEKTDLLKHWDDTFKYITKAKKQGSKVLVHCKMGVSRSASVVIAYAMKAFNWNFDTALQHVKDKRTCIKPNSSFISQLETYQGILDAMKNKEKLQRSKSETNLKSPGNGSKSEKVVIGGEPTPVTQALLKCHDLRTTLSGQDLRQLGTRPKSWSPDNRSSVEVLQSGKNSPIFLSLEDLSQKSASKESIKQIQDQKSSHGRNVLLPCDNGESYSVSPNQIVHLPGQHHDVPLSSVKDIINELESNKESKMDKKKLVLNLPSQFQKAGQQYDVNKAKENFNLANNEQSDNNKTPPMVRTVLAKKEIWDPGEKNPSKVSYTNSTSDVCDLKTNSVSDYQNQTVWTSATIVKNVTESVTTSNNLSNVPESLQSKNVTINGRKDSDPFSNQLDHVFDREEKRQSRLSVIPIVPIQQELSCNNVVRECPSRQSSWSSYDSAVVLGYQNETRELSRHSSWGSGDTRILPSRNSSWGSYDMRPRGIIHYINENGEKTVHPTSAELEPSSNGIFSYDKDEIPWYSGTVKRTKQKLEEGSKKNDSNLNDSLTNSSVSLAKSPSSETLLFDYPLCQDSAPIEAVNTVLVESFSSRNNNNMQQLSINQNSAISNTIDIPTEQYDGSLSRLSVSAPESSSMELVNKECSLSRSASNVSAIGKLPKDHSSSVVSTAQCSSVKQHRMFLENLHRETVNITRKLNDNLDTSGKVKNLKKEFEAKTSTNNIEQNNHTYTHNIETPDVSKTKNRVNSLPSSPVSVHQPKEILKNTDVGEDLNFKNLIVKFESKQDTQVNLRPKYPSKSLTQNKNMRHSCIEVTVDKSPIRITQTPLITNLNKNCSQVDKNVEMDFKRPPIAPVVRNPTNEILVATVIAKATAKKQQQYGKSHPLARINIKHRHNNPVYNTM